MSTTLAFDSAARIPAPGDNVAIATRRLEAGTVIEHGAQRFTLPHTILEGHRFVLEPIAQGAPLLSWGLPFGMASRAVQPGEYVCNEKILRVLAERNIDFELPKAHNFTDFMQTYDLDAKAFQPGQQVPRLAQPGTFPGVRRPGSRGVGTRNFIVVLATTSPTAGFARTLAERFKAAPQQFPNVDGVVAVTHTEGGGASKPNNLEFVMRALSGFLVHANVGAVLALDYGTEPYTNQTLQSFATEHGYPLGDVPHAFFTIAGAFEEEQARAAQVIEDWLPQVNAMERSAQPISELRIALQCGGSDAFSGISGNALAGWVAKEVIKHGGAANLAETDELIGAEPYVLSNVRDLATAQRFLEKIDVFKARCAVHGTSAEGNPSGGNNYRGLYNIALKSIGAARKRDPEVRLDYVIDYGQPMTEGGYYFMDSPGNDLESIAGQVASGCNLIIFITGNGSITNFPFVPTLKFVTTTGRFSMLANEMDVNAGRYNDGMSMDDLGLETFQLALRIAGGERSKGELAGHAQVQLWRDWPQTDASQVDAILNAPKPAGQPLAFLPGTAPDLRIQALKGAAGYTADQVGLIMPTSLCSGQVARQIADKLNARGGDANGLSRYVALAHTEGCGSRGAEHLYLQTLLGHLQHRFVRRAVMLEHGCEYTHNDAVRHYLTGRGLGADRFGWASIQLDGGLEAVTDKVTALFDDALSGQPAPLPEAVGLGELRLGMTATGALPAEQARTMARVAQAVLSAGGTVVLPANAAFARSEAFKSALLQQPDDWRATLAYGQPADNPGLHVMEAPTENSVETFTGLGATGVEVMLAHVGLAPLQAHPMVPLVQVSGMERVAQHFGADLDAVLASAPEQAAGQVLDLVAQTASRAYTPKLFGQGNTDFQLTRGLLGISM